MLVRVNNATITGKEFMHGKEFSGLGMVEEIMWHFANIIIQMLVLCYMPFACAQTVFTGVRIPRVQV